MNELHNFWRGSPSHLLLEVSLRPWLTIFPHSCSTFHNCKSRSSYLNFSGKTTFLCATWLFLSLYRFFLLTILDIESSNLILYIELRSSILQSLWVRHPSHLSRSPLCSIYKGINALYWPSIITMSEKWHLKSSQLDFRFSFWVVTWLGCDNFEFEAKICQYWPKMAEKAPNHQKWPECLESDLMLSQLLKTNFECLC